MKKGASAPSPGHQHSVFLVQQKLHQRLVFIRAFHRLGLEQVTAIDHSGWHATDLHFCGVAIILRHHTGNRKAIYRPFIFVTRHTNTFKQRLDIGTALRWLTVDLDLFEGYRAELGFNVQQSSNGISSL